MAINDDILHEYCPLYKGPITFADCFENHIIAEGCQKADSLPQEIRNIPDFRQICLKCPHHNYD